MITNISIIIPSYNEEENINEIYNRIKPTLEDANISDYEIIFVLDPSFDDSENIIAKKKNFGSRKSIEKTWFELNTALAIKTENKENINEPKTPDRVFLGLILVNFFHLKIIPNTYPPTSEHTTRMIIHNKI